MGKIFDFLQRATGEGSLRGALGHWRQEISQLVDQIAAGEVGDVPTSRNVGAGPGLTGGGNLSQDISLEVGQNADNSIIVNPGDIQVNPALQALIAGSDISVTGGFEYMTQAPWFVSGPGAAIPGNDGNDGTTQATALATLEETNRRTYGRSFSVAPTFTLEGSFGSAHPLVLQFVLPQAFLCTVQAAMTLQYSGTITTFTNMVPSTNTRATINDPSRNFAGDVNRTIRMTSGAAIGAVATILADLGGNTCVVSQFVSQTPILVQAQTPANGDTYVIETQPTNVGVLDINISGRGNVYLKDFESISPTNTATDAKHNRVVASGLPGSTGNAGGAYASRLKFSASGTQVFFSDSQFCMIGCQHTIDTRLLLGEYRLFGHAGFAFLASQGLARCTFNSNHCQQGASAGIGAFNQGLISGLSNIGLFGVTASAMVDIDALALINMTGLIWGVGSTGATAYRIRSGCNLIYGTVGNKPTLTGGTQDALVGGTAKALAAIPYIEPANNAAFTLRA